MKSQASIEYILLYLSALIILIGVIAIIYTSVPASKSVVSSTCNLYNSGITCQDIIVVSNAITHNTVITLALSNSGTSPISNVIIYSKTLSNVTSPKYSCTPSYVSPGGSILCTTTFPQNTNIGDLEAGNLYTNFTSCSLTSAQQKLGTCTGQEQIYIGHFASPVQQPMASPVLLTLVSSTVVSGSKYLLTSQLFIFGYPAKNTEIEFTENDPIYYLNPTFSETNMNGDAFSYISGSTPGSVLVTAIYGNYIATNVITFTLQPGNKAPASTSTTTSTSSTSTSSTSTSSTSTSSTSTSSTSTSSTSTSSTSTSTSSTSTSSTSTSTSSTSTSTSSTSTSSTSTSSTTSTTTAYYSLIVTTDISEPLFSNDVVTQTTYGQQASSITNTTNGCNGPYAPNSCSVLSPSYPITQYGYNGDAAQNMQAGDDAAFMGSLCVLVTDGVYGGNSGVLTTYDINAGPLSSGPNGEELCSVGDGETPFELDSISAACWPENSNGCANSIGVSSSNIQVTIPPNSIVYVSWSRTDPYVTYKNTQPNGWNCGFPAPGVYYDPHTSGSGGFGGDYNGGGTEVAYMNQAGNTIAAAQGPSSQNEQGGPANVIAVQSAVTPSLFAFTQYSNTYTYSTNWWCFNGDEAIQFLGWQGQATGGGSNQGYSGPNPQFYVKDLKNNITETAMWGSTIYINYQIDGANPSGCPYGEGSTNPPSYTNFWGYAPVGTQFTFSAPSPCQDSNGYSFFPVWNVENYNPTAVANPPCGGDWTCYGPAQIECGSTGTLTATNVDGYPPYATLFGYANTQGTSWHSFGDYGAPYVQC